MNIFTAAFIYTPKVPRMISTDFHPVSASNGHLPSNYSLSSVTIHFRFIFASFSLHFRFIFASFSLHFRFILVRFSCTGQLKRASDTHVHHGNPIKKCPMIAMLTGRWRGVCNLQPLATGAFPCRSARGATHTAADSNKSV